MPDSALKSSPRRPLLVRLPSRQRSRISNGRDLLPDIDGRSAVARRFKDIDGQKISGMHAGVGELREVQAAGYPRFFGMAGLHPYFHTPADRAALTSPDLLEPVVRSFVETINDTLTTVR